MKKSILIAALALISAVTFGQDASSQPSPKEKGLITQQFVDSTLNINGSLPFSFALPVTRSQVDSLYGIFHPLSDAYDLTNSLPAGYVTNATVDYTAYLQDGLNKHLHVTMPNFPVLVNMTGSMPALILQSNQTVDCPLFSLLIMKGNALTLNYGFFKLVGLSHVTINNPKLIGDLYTHSVPITGGFGNSIQIYGGDHITINGANITQSAGDGIYEARGGIGSLNASNIIINNSTCNFNGRNGYSFTGVDTLTLLNPIAIGNNSASPSCGLDFEPNTNLDDMGAITITNPITRDNSPVSNHALGLGISIGLKRLFYADPTQKVANLNKVVNITINNPSDCGSGVGFKVSQSILAGSTIKLSGQITVNNPTLSGEYSAANSVDIASPDLKFKLYNPIVYNAAGVLLTGQTALNFILHNQTAGPNIYNSLNNQ